MIQAEPPTLRGGIPDVRAGLPGLPGRAGRRKVAQILEAASDLFLSHDYDAVTMDMVTQASGVSKATLYVYFGSKDDLFSAVVTKEARRIADAVWEPAHDDVDVATGLKQIARNFVEVFMDRRALAFRRTVMGVITRFPLIGQAIFDAGPRILTERVARFLEKADAAGLVVIPDPYRAATLFLSVIRFDLDTKGMLGLALPCSSDIESLTEEGVVMFLRHYAAGRA